MKNLRKYFSPENSDGHLPFFGPGPFIAAGQFLVMIIMVFLSFTVDGFSIKLSFLKMPMIIVGVVLIVSGVYFDYQAKVRSRLFERVGNNELITDGIYAYVRNPVYSALFMIMTGISFLFYDLFLCTVPLINYCFTSFVLIFTEEKWLKEKYGRAYLDYCRKVNRLIPSIRKR